MRTRRRRRSTHTSSDRRRWSSLRQLISSPGVTSSRDRILPTRLRVPARKVIFATGFTSSRRAASRCRATRIRRTTISTVSTGTGVCCRSPRAPDMGFRRRTAGIGQSRHPDADGGVQVARWRHLRAIVRIGVGRARTGAVGRSAITEFRRPSHPRLGHRRAALWRRVPGSGTQRRVRSMPLILATATRQTRRTAPEAPRDGYADPGPGSHRSAGP